VGACRTRRRPGIVREVFGCDTLMKVIDMRDFASTIVIKDGLKTKEAFIALPCQERGTASSTVALVVRLRLPRPSPLRQQSSSLCASPSGGEAA